jgi:two-component system OmpR family response regulator
METHKVLVVDDDPDCSRLVQAILEKTQSFNVKVVNRPNDALRTARDFQPDIFVLDVDMPGKDGGQLASEIRADAMFHAAPILFLTGLISGAETRGGSALRGGMRFLAKPPVAFSLIVAINDLLFEAASARQNSGGYARM